MQASRGVNGGLLLSRCHVLLLTAAVHLVTDNLCSGQVFKLASPVKVHTFP